MGPRDERAALAREHGDAAGGHHDEHVVDDLVDGLLVERQGFWSNGNWVMDGTIEGAGFNSWFTLTWTVTTSSNGLSYTFPFGMEVNADAKDPFVTSGNDPVIGQTFAAFQSSASGNLHVSSSANGIHF
jgi:hypothetical protein